MSWRGEVIKIVREAEKEAKEIRVLKEKPNKTKEDCNFLLDYKRRCLKDALKLLVKGREIVERLEVEIRQLERERAGK